ncbi:MAG: hypothetical protein RMK84_00255 [Oscillochloridaceae bacterium]|nr:hypothetical protein [Chloroflexaceae bacterium]MDW8388528.1 hypothetical protein [Oscillochloridaceae bacterium]
MGRGTLLTRRYAIAGIVATMFIWLAACGGQAVRDPTAPAPPMVAATTTPLPTASPSRAASTVTPGAPVSAPDEVYPGVPRSRTAEGYHQLGDPESPVALVMYSDFL